MAAAGPGFSPRETQAPDKERQRSEETEETPWKNRAKRYDETRRGEGEGEEERRKERFEEARRGEGTRETTRGTKTKTRESRREGRLEGSEEDGDGGWRGLLG